MFPTLKNKFILAPLAGYTDSAFRQLCTEQGASLVYTEMISAEALIRNNKGTRSLLTFQESERPIGLQLFGNNPQTINKVAEEHAGVFDLIDINLGCPAPKIIRQGAGSGLASQIDILKAIFQPLSKLPVPITAKIRTGFDSKSITAVKTAIQLEACGCAAITVHARTVKQGYGGKADWSMIKKVKQAVQIPIIGNGDVTSPEKAKAMMEETGCDYVMIGRAAMGNPYLFRQCDEYMSKGTYLPLSHQHKLKLTKEYLSLAMKYKYPLARIKTQLHQFIKGLPGNARIKVDINKTNNMTDIRNILKTISDNT
jgi:tRNA-dihydrouridine synthase B